MMSLSQEVENITKLHPEILPLHEDSRLIEDCQKLLDKGLGSIP